MANDNSFIIKLQAALDKVKSLANIKEDIKAIESKLSKIKIQGTLNSTSTKKELNTKLKTIKPKVKVDADTTAAEKKIKNIGKQKTKTTIQPTVDNSKVVSGLKTAQKETKTLWEKFVSGAVGANLVRMAVQKVTEAIRQAVAAVKELDTIKTNIQMVSGTSDSGVNALMSSYNVMAKNLSSTTKEVAEAANEFLRMGESVEATNELIKSSQVLSKIGMIESFNAASYLISSLKGYQVAAKDSIDIVSKLTAVDLEAAVSAGGLSEALSKCANIANNSGISMDRLIGYTATVGETTQKSMSEVGNSFQSLLSRMNNIKIGRFIDDETGESLSDTEAVLNKLGIQLRDTENTYRDFDDVLDDVGSRWKDFTKVEQNAISVAIAGTRQRENFEALMNNWANALKYAETAANSAGSALERYRVYQDSIEAKTNELTAAMESLSTNTISEELYSGIIVATTNVVEFIDKANLLKGTLAGLVTMGVSKTIVSLGAGFITAAKSTAQLTAAMALFDKGKSTANLKAIGAACKGLSSQQLKLVLSTKNLTDEERQKILIGMGLEKQEQEQMLATLGFASAENVATASTFSLKGAWNSLKVAMATNPIGVIVSTVSVAVMIFSGFNQAMEESRQKARDLGEELKSTKSDIDSYKSKIEDLYKTINDSNSSIYDVTEARKNLMTIQDELIEKFGDEKEVIDIITQAVNGQADAFDRLAEKQWQETKNQFNDTGFWMGTGNWLDGYGTNIDRMVDKMEHAREILSFSANDLGSDKFDDLVYQMEKLGWMYQGTLGGFVKEGNLKGIYSDILDIQNIVKDLDAPDGFLKDLTHDANQAKETLEDYSAIWDTYILRDVILENDNLAQSWNEVNEAYSEYKKAFESGNKEAQNSAIDGFSQSLNNVLDNSDVTESVKEYFKNMYPTLTNEVEKWEFRYKILPDLDIHALKGKTQADILEMLQVDGSQYGEDTFNSLLRMASDYGIVIGDDSKKIEQLLDLLVEWEVLQRNIDDIDTPQNTTSLSSQLTTSTDSLDKFQSSVKSAADAYTTLLTGNYSSSELLDSIQAITKAASDMGESIDWESISTSGNPLQAIQDAIESVSKTYADSVLSGTGIDSDSKFGQMLANIIQEAYKSEAALSSLNIQVDSLQSAYSSLTDIIQTYNETGYITFDQLQTLLAMEPQYVACLIDENGQLKLNQESMLALANQRLNDAESQAIQQAMTELGKVAFQEEQTAVEDNAQAFSDAVDDLSTYNEGLAETIATANVATSEILKLNDAINGAESEGATDDQIDSVLDNLNTKLKLIQNTRNNLKQNFNNFGKIVGKSSSDSSPSASSSTETTKEFSEELNWVEKLINKVSTALDKLKDKVSNTYIGWSVRNHSLSKAMEKTNDVINVQQQAYEKYMQEAASVGLSQDYIAKIQNGTLDIEDITDEALSDKIKEYETWYDKATDCSDAIEELKAQLSELAKQRFDNINTYFEGLMETTEKAISRLETKEKNTFKAPSARVYNGLYDETQNLINYNTQRVQQLEEALDSAAHSGYIETGSEAWRDMYNEILDVRNATEEYKIELQEISKRSYEALLKPIEQELAELEQRKNTIEKTQDRLALQGYVAAKGLYERQLRDSESRLQTLKEEANQLQQNMQDALSKGLEVGSDDWIDMKSAIDDNVSSIMELENSMIELNNALRDLEWDKFDRLQKSISRITGESDFMIDMFDKEDIYDEDGKLTDAGSAVIGLHAQNYFTYKEQAKAYKDEVDKINKELAADPTNTTLIDRKNDLIDAYQNATKAAYDEYEAVIELGKDGYQAQIDSIQELIDAKKKQLEADKSLYEYQKSVAEKTKNITDIQKQLSALANDDSEENKAKIQKLKVDLADAQKDLEDTQYDKWYNDQQDMLDRLAEEYAALISEQSQNEQELFQEMIEYVNANAQGIQDAISATAQEWGYVFNYGIDSVLEPGISGMTDIGQNIYEEIQRLYELNERMYRVSADLADLGVTDYGLETTISDETTARNFIERLYNGLLGRQSDEDGLNFWMDKLMNGATVQEMLEGFLNSDEYKAMGKSPEDTILDFYRGLLGREAETEGFNYWMEQYRNGVSLSEIGTHGFLDSDEFLSRDHWLNILDAKPIASSEMPKPVVGDIGGIPAEKVKAFQELIKANMLANNMISAQNLGIPDYSKMQNVVNNANRSFGDTNIKNEIHFSIDHVADYNDLVTQMQKDGKFEKMIEDMTIGKLAGKSSLAKNSYKWT